VILRFVGSEHMKVYRNPAMGLECSPGDEVEVPPADGQYLLETFPALWVMAAPAKRNAALKRPPKHAAEE
jgi:hypothetical protein